jgi:hypothetical protein
VLTTIQTLIPALVDNIITLAAEVAQVVKLWIENHSVGSSALLLGTRQERVLLRASSHGSIERKRFTSGTPPCQGRKWRVQIPPCAPAEVADFEVACSQRHIRLFIPPPHSPKLNGQMEPAHRTHIEEFYEVYEGEWSQHAPNPVPLLWEPDYNPIRPTRP